MTQRHTATSQASIERITAGAQALRDQAYQDGWRDAIAHVLNAAKSAHDSNDHHTPNSHSHNGHAQAKSTPDNSPQRGEIKNGVQTYIKSHQGKTRLEVIAGVTTINPKANAASVRTAIKRLIRKGAVQVREERLY